MRLRSMQAAFAISLCVASPANAEAAEFKFAELGFAVTTDESWSIADAATLKLMNHFASQSAVAHARLKGISAWPEHVDSALLLWCSKFPVGTLRDNPNVALAKEKAWSDECEKSGAGYLKLMQERVRLLGMPTKFTGEVKELKIGNTDFHQMDAVNTRVPNVEQIQRYVCAFKDGYYIYFVVTYNKEGDAVFLTMMQLVSSFRIEQK